MRDEQRLKYFRIFLIIFRLIFVCSGIDNGKINKEYPLNLTFYDIPNLGKVWVFSIYR